MPLLNYTSTVDADKTAQEIAKMKKEKKNASEGLFVLRINCKYLDTHGIFFAVFYRVFKGT